MQVRDLLRRRRSEKEEGRNKEDGGVSGLGEYEYGRWWREDRSF